MSFGCNSCGGVCKSCNEFASVSFIVWPFLMDFSLGEMEKKVCRGHFCRVEWPISSWRSVTRVCFRQSVSKQKTLQASEGVLRSQHILFSMWSSSVDVESRLDLGLFFTDVLPYCKPWYSIRYFAHDSNHLLRRPLKKQTNKKTKNKGKILHMYPFKFTGEKISVFIYQ